MIDDPDGRYARLTPRRAGAGRLAAATIASLLLPGLGHLVLGRPRRAVVFLAPILIALGALAVIVVSRGVFLTAALATQPWILRTAAAVEGAWLLWAFAAASDAWRLGRAGHGVRLALIPAALAIALSVGVAAAASVELNAAATLEAVVAAPEPSGDWTIPGYSPAPTTEPSQTAGTTPGPTAAPVPAWAEDGRLNVLLIGSDAGPGRWSLRTDTMMVLSVELSSGRVALFGLPRNLENVPLPAESAAAFPNGRYPGFLNSLYVYANEHPSQFPGGSARGFRALSGAIQQLIGAQLDGVVVIDLNGFVRLVDALGGVTINVKQPLHDDAYPMEDGSGHVVIDIPAGVQHFDGHWALAYARTRHQDSDYYRMQRQQTVVEALAKQVDPLTVLARANDLLAIAKDDLWTTFALDQLPDLANVARVANVRNITKVFYSPPKYREWVTDQEWALMKTTFANVFDVVDTEPIPAPKPVWVPA